MLRKVCFEVFQVFDYRFFSQQRRLLAVVATAVCAVTLLSVSNKDGLVGKTHRSPAFVDTIAATQWQDTVGTLWENHPAMKVLENPTPLVDKDDPDKAVPVGQEIKLEADKLYSPMNQLGSDPAAGRWDFNTGVYQLLPTGEQDKDGKDTFDAGRIMSYADSAVNRAKGYWREWLYGAAMGIDATEENKTVMYLTHGVYGENNYGFPNNTKVIWKAIAGEQNLYKVADIPAFFGRSPCYNSNTAVAPNGTLWIVTDRDDEGNPDPDEPSGRAVISMLDPQLDDQGKGRLIHSAKPEDPNNPNSKLKTTIVDALDPTRTLPVGACLRGGVFDEDGFYYARTGAIGSNAADNIFRFDLSEFPEKVTYTQIDFDIDQFGVGLSWQDSRWWSAPFHERWTTDKDYPVKPGEELPEARQLFTVNPKTAVKTLADISTPNGSPLVPVNNMTSTSLVPPLELDVKHGPKPVDAIEAVRENTVDYTVTISNKEDSGGGLWFTGEAAVELNDVLGSVKDVNANDSIVEVKGHDGNPPPEDGDHGEVRRSGTQLIWKGTIPIGGTLTWKYGLTLAWNAADGKELTTSVVTSPGWRSNCSPENAVGNQDCQAQASIRDSNLHVNKTADDTKMHSQGIIKYIITAENKGSRLYNNKIIDDLTEVLPYAKYNNDAKVDLGSVPVFASSTLTWEGQIEPEEKLTITYSVQLQSTIVGAKPPP